MPQTKVVEEQVGFAISQLLELWTLDGTAIGMDTIYRFVNCSTNVFQPVVFGGVTYLPFPIKVEGMESDGKGQLPRPRLSVSNINGFVSSMLLGNGNSLDGATITRTRVFARFLDAVNFPTPTPRWVTPDPTAHYAPEPFLVNRKVVENPQIVMWEMASVLEMQGAKLPKRTILANTCADFKYRQPGTCDYSGVPAADIQNRTFTGPFHSMTLTDQGEYDAGTTYNRGDYVYTISTLPQFRNIKFLWVCAVDGTVGVPPSGTSGKWIADACAKNSAACKLRFGDAPLRISAFPGVSRAGFIPRS